MELPPEYLAYLDAPGSRMEGFLEDLECSPGYFALWPGVEIVQNNTLYEVALLAPGFLAFGTNGGSELLVFDATGAVSMLHMIGLAPDEAIKVCDSWEDFVALISPPF